jgi:cytochrome P450
MRPLAFLQELRAEHGDVFTIRVLHEQPWVMVGDPELVKAVFAAPSDVLHAGEGNRVLQPVLGPSSVLLLDGERHLHQRRLLLGPFRGSHVARYTDTMRAVADAEIDRWPVGAAVASLPLMRSLTLEVILRTVFGVETGDGLEGLRADLGSLPLPQNAGAMADSTFVHAVARVDRRVFAEIAKRRGDSKLREREDVLSLLLRARYEDGSAMSDEEIRDELMTLLVAGHETTASSLAWALERLVRTPHALREVESEAAEGGGPYTEAAIYETLRLRPPVPMVARMVKRPFQLGDHLIGPGVTIMPSVLLIHHHPDIYDDPAGFRPERFLDTPPGTYSWIPFGGGIRRCIGTSFALLEMRIVLSALLTRMEARPIDLRAEPMRRRAVTLTPGQGGRIVLEPRKPQRR